MYERVYSVLAEQHRHLWRVAVEGVKERAAEQTADGLLNANKASMY